jgi:hypothetical protein
MEEDLLSRNGRPYCPPDVWYVLVIIDPPQERSEWKAGHILLVARADIVMAMMMFGLNMGPPVNDFFADRHPHFELLLGPWLNFH